jgi:hypothetical protein
MATGFTEHLQIVTTSNYRAIRSNIHKIKPNSMWDSRLLGLCLNTSSSSLVWRHVVCSSCADAVTRYLHLLGWTSSERKRRYFFNFVGLGETESTWYVGHYWPTVAAPYDIYTETCSETRTDSRNRNTRRKLPRRHFVHHKSHMTWPGLETAWAMARPKARADIEGNQAKKLCHKLVNGREQPQN